MGNETLSALQFLNKQFKKSIHRGSRLKKLDQLNKSKDQKPEIDEDSDEETLMIK